MFSRLKGIGDQMSLMGDKVYILYVFYSFLYVLLSRLTKLFAFYKFYSVFHQLKDILWGL